MATHPIETRWTDDVAPETLARWRREAADHRAETTEWLRDCERFLLFVGFQRSGHSLLGSLLDAHPNMIVGHELHALRFVEEGFGFEDLCYLIRRNAEEAARTGREQTGYSYAVPGGWQGRCDRCLVVGDKKGGMTAQRIAQDPGAFDRFAETITRPVRVVVVVRNPFDNVATISRRKRSDLESALRAYEVLCDGVDVVRSRLPEDELLLLRHEDVMAQTDATLTRVADFLGVEPLPAWREACGRVVWNRPFRTRHDVEWPPKVRRRLDELIARQSILSEYSFED